jgi:hypothetical protein
MCPRIPNILFLLVALLGCSKDDNDPAAFTDDPSITTLNGTWKVKSFEDFTLNTVEFKTQENSYGFDITVTFDDSKQPHQISGENTTNTIAGEFEYIGDRKLSISHVGSTEVAQPRWADQFIDAVLQRNLNYKINATFLRIYYDNDSKSVTLVRI